MHRTRVRRLDVACRGGSGLRPPLGDRRAQGQCLGVGRQAQIGLQLHSCRVAGLERGCAGPACRAGAHQRPQRRAVMGLHPHQLGRGPFDRRPVGGILGGVDPGPQQVAQPLDPVRAALAQPLLKAFLAYVHVREQFRPHRAAQQLRRRVTCHHRIGVAGDLVTCEPYPLVVGLQGLGGRTQCAAQRGEFLPQRSPRLRLAPTAPEQIGGAPSADRPPRRQRQHRQQSPRFTGRQLQPSAAVIGDEGADQRQVQFRHCIDHGARAPKTR